MPLGIDAARLARMRAQAAQLMPDTCIIYSSTVTSDAQGGVTETWTASGTVACRMGMISARTRTEVQAAREARTLFYQLTVPYDAPLDVFSQVVHAGVTYQVAETHEHESWAVTRRARLVIVE